MKKINIILSISAIFLVSCSGRINNFSAQKYTHFQKGAVVSTHTPEDRTDRADVVKMNTTEATTINAAEITIESPSEFSTLSADNNTLVIPDKIHFIQAWNTMDKQEKKEVISAIKTTYKAAKTENAKVSVDALELICAIFIPPLGVFLHEGGITNNFWIDLILTILLFLPGMIFAILVVTDNIN